MSYQNILSEQNLLNLFNEMKIHTDQCEKELESLLGGKKASAPRARKLLGLIKVHSHSLRKLITEHLKSLPTKTRKVKEPEVKPVEVESVPEPPEVESVPEVKVKKPRKPRLIKKKQKISD